MSYQKTLAKEASITGIGLHSGKDVSVKLKPAEEFTGVVFVRTDESAGSGAINVCAEAVSDTQLCTVLKNEYGVKVGTVEHLMAALYALGVDNVIVELDAEELPILDGSSAPWVELIDKAGLKDQQEQRKMIKITKEVIVKEGNCVASVKPAGEFGLHIFIHYGDKIPPMQDDFGDDEFAFRYELARARTFCFEKDVEYMHSMGLAKGGSLENAVVLNEKGEAINEEPLRYPDEFIRHKALDCFGDFYMSGYRIVGQFNVTRPGHEMNNRLLKAILSNPQNWKWV